jgi:hypothetical protein
VTDDIFGDVIDVDLIEQAARATLRAWLPSHLAHQERRRGLTEHIKPPRSWPTVSDFDPLVQEQLTVRDVVDPAVGPMVPPPDPYDPPDPQAPFETSDIAVTPHNLTEELA